MSSSLALGLIPSTLKWLIIFVPAGDGLVSQDKRLSADYLSICGIMISQRWIIAEMRIRRQTTLLAFMTEIVAFIRLDENRRRFWR